MKKYIFVKDFVYFLKGKYNVNFLPLLKYFSYVYMGYAFTVEGIRTCYFSKIYAKNNVLYVDFDQIKGVIRFYTGSVTLLSFKADVNECMEYFDKDIDKRICTL